jgi:hypothetical protein
MTALPKIKKSLHFHESLKQKGELEMLESAQIHKENPLRTSQTHKWFKESHAPISYQQTVEDKVLKLELQRLFEIFDADNSG